jgi:hypothetical protein
MKWLSVKTRARTLLFAVCALIIGAGLSGRSDGQAVTAPAQPPGMSTVPPDVMIRYVPAPLIAKRAFTKDSGHAEHHMGDGGDHRSPL